MTKRALIVGAGEGISAAFARTLCEAGYKVALAARDVKKLSGLADDISGSVFTCDASSHKSVLSLFENLDRDFGSPNVVLYNPSMRVRGDFTELDPEEVQTAVSVTALGGLFVAQQAIKRMEKQGGGKIFFTGASASIKGFPGSSVFAMGKFALRGLAQSLAREFGPKGIHVAHFIIDGSVDLPGRDNTVGYLATKNPEDFLQPEAIAETYMHVLRQPPSAWLHEVDLRPATEKF
jgi:NAD(P)-dependent dehydrogenase (short-subunit alcohol dehydrogenase family)